MNGRIKRCSAFLSAIMMLFTGCASKAEAREPLPVTEETARVGDVAEKAPEPETHPLREDKSIYSDTSEVSELVTMYLTVREGNAEDSTNHTWTEVNSHDTYYYSENHIDRYACEAILQVGDENGPKEGEFGYGETVPNATVCVRGQTSSRSTQKNYKVRIKDGKGTYKDMQTLPLNKFVSDGLRYRNKLVFDLMQPVPQMTAIRTQFVHLYVKDETEGGSGEFEDYGLYTRMEQINKDYLENHGLDRKAHLYKLVLFEFYEYEPVMKLEADSAFDKWAFEAILKPKGDKDHSKLQALLTAVNDYTIPVEDIVDKYFDLENICYFLAYHILVGNTDVGPRNEYIYSPLNSDRWYFLSWDCDGSFIRTRNLLQNYSGGESWEQGITQFTGVVLFNRILRVQKYRDALTAAINDLRENYLTEDRINALTDIYKDIVLPFITSPPDSEHYGRPIEEFKYISDRLSGEIDYNYNVYLESLEKPWPFYVALPEMTEDGKMRLSWGASYDLDGEDITYRCILANDSAFTDVIFEQDSLKTPGVSCDVKLDPGRYFIRVIATNESGYSIDCFDYYSQDESINGKRYGCMAFEVLEDGTFVSILNEE